MKKSAIIFSIGGILYPLIEIAWRGHSHYSMAIAGGLSLIMIDLVAERLRGISVIATAAIGAVMITVIEFVSGIIFNLMLGMNVWDYSAVPYNILGQICPQFTVIWFIISFPAIYLCRICSKVINKLELTDKRPALGSSPNPGQ